LTWAAGLYTIILKYKRLNKDTVIPGDNKSGINTVFINDIYMIYIYKIM